MGANRVDIGSGCFEACERLQSEARTELFFQLTREEKRDQAPNEKKNDPSIHFPFCVKIHFHGINIHRRYKTWFIYHSRNRPSQYSS